jgi:hypothetical protein
MTSARMKPRSMSLWMRPAPLTAGQVPFSVWNPHARL